MTEESLFSAGRTQGTQAVACEQGDCHGGAHLNSYTLWRKSVILDVVLGRKKQYLFRHICRFSQMWEKIVATEVLIPNSGEKCYFRSSFWEATFVLS